MKVMFKGIKITENRGCPVCSGRKKTVSLKRYKTFILPSGRIIKCNAGCEYDVIESDAKFLLSMDDVFEVA